MRAGRFGSKAGRVAVVAAFVLGTLAVGTTAAGAAELNSGGSSASTVGQAVEVSSAAVATTFATEWE
jgi:hypothetical protein